MADDIIDPDYDAADPAQRRELRPREWDIFTAIAVGGILGAEARYAIDELLPHRRDEFSWSTLIINATGCLLIGLLMSWLAQRTHPPRLARPFIGVGILGGYTTFSTFAVDVHSLIDAGRLWVAVAYVLTTVVAGWTAVVGGQRLGPALWVRGR